MGEYALCPWADDCLNGHSDCYNSSGEPENCIRFLPLTGNNITKIDGVVETPHGIDHDKFWQYFINWIDAMGWHFTGMIVPCEEE